VSTLFTHPEFDGHEQVLFGYDESTGLRGIIAIHSTRLGPSLGGCRMYPYASEDQALTDVLRLSRGMSYKAALAGLHQGGGKSVIIGDPRADKTPSLMQAMGAQVDRLGGAYIVAEDSGIAVADVAAMASRTAHVCGVAAPGASHDGNPSPATALGTFLAIRACVRRVLGRDDLRGVGVAIQGVGSVGARLAGHLAKAGARLWVSDTHQASAEACAAATGATPVAPDAIFDTPAEVFSPCALGAVLDAATIPRLRARIVAGAANNQLATAADDARLRDAGILYAPDYVINAGGIIDIHYHRPSQGLHYDAGAARQHLETIATRLDAIFDIAAREGRPTAAVADTMARDILARGLKAH